VVSWMPNKNRIRVAQVTPWQVAIPIQNGGGCTTNQDGGHSG